MPADSWADNGGVRVHYLDSATDAHRVQVPILFIPGMLGVAEDYVTEMDYLAPRRSVGVSLRGRGKSDAPETGYSFENHVADIEAVVARSSLGRFGLMGYSVGGAYALGFAIRNPDQVRGIIVGDYPATYPKFPARWAERALELAGDRTKPHVPPGLQADSTRISLWEHLEVLRCPLLLIRGGRRGSLLTSYGVRRYRHHMPQAETVVFRESGHELWVPDRERYLRTLKDFLERLDVSA